MDFQRKNTFTQSQSLFNCWSIYTFTLGISEIRWVKDIWIINFLDLLKRRAGWHCEKRKYSYSIYILSCSQETAFPISKPAKKKITKTRDENRRAWAMNPSDQIFFSDFDIYKNKVKLNCKIKFSAKHWYEFWIKRLIRWPLYNCFKWNFSLIKQMKWEIEFRFFVKI